MVTTLRPAPDLEDEIVLDTIPMSYEQYLTWSEEEGHHGEWVDGEVIPFMTTSDRHQRIQAFLFTLIYNVVDLRQLGRVYQSTFEMRSRETSAREPDIMVVLNANRDRIEEVRLRGAGDLVVEIISPDSVMRDRRTKFAEYEAAGVPEYWLIDPRAGRERLEVFVLDSTGKYQPVTPDVDSRIFSHVLRGVWAHPEWLNVDEPLPGVVGLAMKMADVTDAG